MKACDYHDLPLVCGECDRAGVLDFGPRHRPALVYEGVPNFHTFVPVHQIVDPEGFEGTAKVPCGLA